MTVTWVQLAALVFAAFTFGLSLMNWRWSLAIRRGTRGFKASLKAELEEIREQQEGFWRQLDAEIERNPALGVYLRDGLRKRGKGASA